MVSALRQLIGTRGDSRGGRPPVPRTVGGRAAHRAAPVRHARGRVGGGDREPPRDRRRGRDDAVQVARGLPDARAQRPVVDDRPAARRRRNASLPGFRPRLGVLPRAGTRAPDPRELRPGGRPVRRGPLSIPGTRVLARGADPSRCAAGGRDQLGVRLQLRRRAPTLGERDGAGDRARGALRRRTRRPGTACTSRWPRGRSPFSRRPRPAA